MTSALLLGGRGITTARMKNEQDVRANISTTMEHTQKMLCRIVNNQVIYKKIPLLLQSEVLAKSFSISHGHRCSAGKKKRRKNKIKNRRLVQNAPYQLKDLESRPATSSL